MSLILRIDSSARIEHSRSRRLTQAYVDGWRDVDPGVRVISRDLAADPVPCIDAAWIESPCAPSRAWSDRLLDEVRRADHWVIGAPMYNWGMPASLKAWFDQVVVEGQTFLYDPRAQPPYLPALFGKRAVVVSTRATGGYGVGEPMAAMNHLDPHLGTLLGVMGVHLDRFISVNAYDAEAMAAAMSAAREAGRMAARHSMDAHRDGCPTTTKEGVS